MKNLLICMSAATALLAGTAQAQNASQSTPSADWRTVAPENLWVIDTSKGRVLVELEPRVAPNHIERVRALTNQNFYDGLKFHRVIPDFMAQTGDPKGTGEGGSELPDIAAEFSFRRGRDSGYVAVPNGGPGHIGTVGSVVVSTQPDAQMMINADMKVWATPLFCAGTAGMARSGQPNSANSQFYLTTGHADTLNGNYTAFGRVLSGLDVVKSLKAGSEAADGAVGEGADVMTRVRLASQLPPAERPQVRVAVVGGTTFNAAVEAARTAKGNGFTACDIQIPVQVDNG